MLKYRIINNYSHVQQLHTDISNADIIPIIIIRVAFVPKTIGVNFLINHVSQGSAVLLVLAGSACAKWLLCSRLFDEMSIPTRQCHEPNLWHLEKNWTATYNAITYLVGFIFIFNIWLLRQRGWWIPQISVWQCFCDIDMSSI